MTADIGNLKARVMILESHVAALAAFACAMLDSHPQRDVIETRWGKHLGPALHRFGDIDAGATPAAGLVEWVSGHLDEPGKA